MDLKVTSEEMVKMINRASRYKRNSFYFGPSGCKVNESDQDAIDLLQEIRDEKELELWHKPFKI